MNELRQKVPQGGSISYPLLIVMIFGFKQGCADGTRRVRRSPMFSNLQERWSKVSYAARELATVFSVTIFV